MAIRKSSSSGIPFGLNAGRPANPGYGQLYSNGETARLEIYTQDSGWQNIVQETPGVASITGHYYESDASGEFVVSGTNFVSGAIAYAVGTNGVEYQATTTTYNSLVQLTVVFDDLSPEHEPYDVKVTNPSNLFGLLPDAFYINDNPVWSTSSGSLGTLPNGSVSIQLASTDDESESRTYAISSGALPNGLSLSSSGLISGTMSANPATYSFAVTISDGINTPVARSFSISVPAPVITGGNLSSDSTYYYRTFTSNGTLSISNNQLNADVLIVAGGGGGANGNGSPGGGGAGGVVSLSNYLLSSQSHTITVGGGATQNSAANDLSGNRGSNSYLNSVLALGGGGGVGWGGSRTNTDSAGSGGGGSGNSNSGGSTAQSSQNSGVSGLTQYGNIGGNAGSWPTYAGGGGGGAGAAGGNSTTTNAGSGGVGTSLFSSWGLATSTGHNVSGTYYYAGGGGGGMEDSAGPSGSAGSGGLGGGGAGRGRGQGTLDGVSGTANTGGGGGSGGWTGAGGRPGGGGGSGIVIVRYTKASVGG